jgi:hypothetical protein
LGRTERSQHGLYSEFKTSLSYIERPCLQNKKEKKKEGRKERKKEKNGYVYGYVSKLKGQRWGGCQGRQEKLGVELQVGVCHTQKKIGRVFWAKGTTQGHKLRATQLTSEHLQV